MRARCLRTNKPAAAKIAVVLFNKRQLVVFVEKHKKQLTSIMRGSKILTKQKGLIYKALTLEPVVPAFSLFKIQTIVIY